MTSTIIAHPMAAVKTNGIGEKSGRRTSGEADRIGVVRDDGRTFGQFFTIEDAEQRLNLWS